MEGSIKRKQRQIDLNRMLGTHLAKLRRAHDLNQVDVAERMDFQRALVSKIESGNRPLDAMEIRDYAGALGIEPSELYQVIDAIVCEYDGARQADAREKDDRATDTTDVADGYKSC